MIMILPDSIVRQPASFGETIMSLFFFAWQRRIPFQNNHVAADFAITP
jgi:hypothetical protein